jgi:hypothetical protein
MRDEFVELVSRGVLLLRESSTDVNEFLGVDQGVDEVINAAET